MVLEVDFQSLVSEDRLLVAENGVGEFGVEGMAETVWCDERDVDGIVGAGGP